MTPTATRLEARLADRRRWFQNEWFFKWHHIGGANVISIDTFDGRFAQYAGLRFQGSPRDIYWDAIVRGIRNEIVNQFSWVEAEIQRYDRDTAIAAIDECAGLLASFTHAIRREAVKKDRTLRGDGVTFPPENDAGYWDGTSNADISAQAEALKAALPRAPSSPATVPKSAVHIWWDANQGWLGPTGWIAGIIGTATGIYALFHVS